MSAFYKTALALLTFYTAPCLAQNPLFIPPVLTGTTFNLNVQTGTTVLYGAIPTTTYGVNGVWMAPTLVVNKGDSITLNVKNQMSMNTTMHWHGLHVAAMNDGGPHQMIMPGMTWSPSFTVRNNAATFWYHPHGAGQTDLQVSRGISGFFIVKDSAEAALSLPRNYGVDDFPLNVQTRAFDQLKQIAIATDLDTGIFVNGTRNPLLKVPAQVVRFRLLNGSSMRSYYFGLSGNHPFYQIGTDGGLLDSSVQLTRLLLSPGERAEILVDFGSMLGQDIHLRSFASEMPAGIYGSDTVGDDDNPMMDYMSNKLNGVDFNILALHVDSTTANPVTAIATALIPFHPLDPASATHVRNMVLDTMRLLPADKPNRAAGPFGINKQTFSMDVVNNVVRLNTTEVWQLINRTLVAHPFHIHDVQFNVIEKNKQVPSPSDRGWKDVVLVMPGDTVKFITRFETFTDATTPYMYHCHLLHHEDDGMMGSFIVVDSSWVGTREVPGSPLLVYPNPASQRLYFSLNSSPDLPHSLEIRNTLGQLVLHRDFQSTAESAGGLDISSLVRGVYLVQLHTHKGTLNTKVYLD